MDIERLRVQVIDLGVLLTVGALTGLVMHFPALWHARDAIVGSLGSSEQSKALWGAWLSGQLWPRLGGITHLAAFPEGVDALPLPPISLWMVAPVSRWIGPTWAVGCLALVTSTISALGAGLLARELKCSRAGMVAAAIVLATWPSSRSALSRGVHEYLTIGWFALYLTFFIRVCRGRFREAPVAALLFMVTLVECGLYGSAAFLASLLWALLLVRTRGSVVSLATFVPLVTLLSVGVMSSVMPYLEQLRSTPPPPPGIYAAPHHLLGFALSPNDELGYPIGPLHWLFFILGISSRPRGAVFPALMAFVFAAIALATPLAHLWMATLPGRHAANVAHYLAPVGVFFAVLTGFAADGVMKWLEAAVQGPFASRGGERLRVFLHLPAWVGVGVGALAGVPAVVACGWWWQYPLTPVPPVPSFAKAVMESPERGAIVVLPVLDPWSLGRVATQRSRLSVSPRLDSPACRLWLQTVINRPVRDFPGMVTVRLQTVKNLRLDEFPRPEPDLQEVRWMRQSGAHLFLLDHALLADRLIPWQNHLTSDGALCTDYSDWGGVTLCRFAPLKVPLLSRPSPALPFQVPVYKAERDQGRTLTTPGR